MALLDNNIEDISKINEFIDINIDLVNSLKETYKDKQDLYDFVYSILCLNKMGTFDCKHTTEAQKLKKELYPNVIEIIAGYYCPKIYWIAMLLLENDNNLFSYCLKAEVLANLPGQPTQYNNVNCYNLRLQCLNNSTYYYELFFKEYKASNNKELPYFIHIHSELSRMADNYLELKEYETALKYYVMNYSEQKNAHSAKRIAFIKSNNNMDKKLELLNYYYEDMKQNNAYKREINSINKDISYLKEWIRLKEEVYKLMKQGKKQTEIMEELDIDKGKIRIVINYLKDDGKVEKINNKYVAI